MKLHDRNMHCNIAQLQRIMTTVAERCDVTRAAIIFIGLSQQMEPELGY